MKTEQVNLRLEADLIAALEGAAREESLDRGTIIRKLLRRALSERRLDRALEQYQHGEISMGRAAQEAGVTHWEILEHVRRRGIAYPLDAKEVDSRLEAITGRPPHLAEAPRAYRVRDRRGLEAETLPDRPPKPEGVLLIGVNPAPTSVRAGHYYQGRLGKRLWQRLARLGLLANAVPGAEDDAFVGAGHGLTDIAKRPTRSSSELESDEIGIGVEALRPKVAAWRPGLILFAFKEAARAVTGMSRLSPGKGPSFEGVPTFLLSGPYASRHLAEGNDEELRRLLLTASARPPEGASTQRITPSDIASGIVRVPEDAMHLLPRRRAEVPIVIRGRRLTARFDPRRGPDPRRSGRVHVGRKTLERLVKPGERLRVSRADDGSVHFD